MSEKLKDKLFLLKFIYENSDNLDLNESVKTQIKYIFQHFKDFLTDTKLDKKEENKLNKYLDLINTYDSKQILILGNKILQDGTSVYTG